MSKVRDLFGIRHGKLTPFSATKSNGIISWHCICKCGFEIIVPQDELENKIVDSCELCAGESKKDVLITVRLSQELINKLDALCLDYSDNRSNLIRNLILKEYSENISNTC